MRYLVTGGAGFVGSNLAVEVLRRGDELIVFDNLSREGSSKNLQWLREQKDFRFVYGDMRNSQDVDYLLSSTKPDVVFHLAGQVAMTSSIERPLNDFEINAYGTVTLLEAVRKHAPEAAVLYSSTNKVYGDLEDFEYEETNTRYICHEHPHGFSETLPLDFSTPYGCSKGAADQYIRDYHRMFGLNTVVFRHSSIYGGRQFATFDQGWVGWFVKQALETKSNPDHRFTVSGNGKQVRDLLFAEDVVNLYFLGAERINRISGMVFNIGGELKNSLSIIELNSFLEQEFDVSLNVDHLPPRARDQKVFVADISTVQREIGWSPMIDTNTGIRRQAEWLLAQR